MEENMFGIDRDVFLRECLAQGCTEMQYGRGNDWVPHPTHTTLIHKIEHMRACFHPDGRVAVWYKAKVEDQWMTTARLNPKVDIHPNLREYHEFVTKNQIKVRPWRSLAGFLATLPQ